MVQPCISSPLFETQVEIQDETLSESPPVAGQQLSRVALRRVPMVELATGTATIAAPTPQQPTNLVLLLPSPHPRAHSLSLSMLLLRSTCRFPLFGFSFPPFPSRVHVISAGVVCVDAVPADVLCAAKSARGIRRTGYIAMFAFADLTLSELPDPRSCL